MTIDFDDLPEDPYRAFIKIVQHFDDDLNEQVGAVPEEADTRLALLNHMSNVLAAARALEIDQLSSWTLPDMDNVYGTHRDFNMAVKGLVLQFQIKNARTNKTYSVALDQSSRERIHSLINEIRGAIERSDLTADKKNSLYAKLNAFAADVDRARTKFDNAMLMFLTVGHASTDMLKEAGAALAPVNELLGRIERILGKAKSADSETDRIPAPDELKKIEPPKKQISGFGRSKTSDDVPF